MQNSNMVAEYIDHMGSDLSVINSAKASFGKQDTEFKPKEHTRLINYLARGMTHADYEQMIKTAFSLGGLMEDMPSGGGQADLVERMVGLFEQYRHTGSHFSPFCHATISIRFKAPIAIHAQFMKHTVGFSHNSISRRYVSDRPELYVPNFWRTKPIGNIKQGSGTGKVDINTEFKKGFCINCGAKFPIVRTGRDKKYCSVECKTKFTNRNRNPYKTVFQNCKARVEREGVRKWELDFDTFEFPEYCKYLGIKLDYSYGKGAICDNSPSFDRIDSNKDYTPDNVQVISHKANTMKSSANNDELVTFAKNVLLMHGGYITCGSSYEQVCNEMIDLYEAMIKADISPEQARFVLPQGVMTEWVTTGSLYAWARLYNLRADGHAQKEIQTLAHMIELIVEPLFPVSWAALTGQ